MCDYVSSTCFESNGFCTHCSCKIFFGEIPKYDYWHGCNFSVTMKTHVIIKFCFFLNNQCTIAFKEIKNVTFKIIFSPI